MEHRTKTVHNSNFFVVVLTDRISKSLIIFGVLFGFFFNTVFFYKVLTNRKSRVWFKVIMEEKRNRDVGPAVTTC